MSREPLRTDRGTYQEAVLSALSIAAARDLEAPAIQKQDLDEGAQLQLQGRIRMSDFEDRVVPTRGMDELVLSEAVERCLMDLVGFVKSELIRRVQLPWFPYPPDPPDGPRTGASAPAQVAGRSHVSATTPRAETRLMVLE
jgi:hypothetical protein